LYEEDIEFKKMNDSIFDEKSLKTVREISKEVLSIRENILHIFNILEQRTHVAKLHLESYKTLKFETEKLLSEIKTKINEQ
jgi:predicted transcriptional regulator